MRVQQRHQRRYKPEQVLIADNLPSLPPVAAGELEVIERYLADVLTELLEHPAPPALAATSGSPSDDKMMRVTPLARRSGRARSSLE